MTLDRARDHPHTSDRWVPFLFGFLRGGVFGLAGGILIDPLFGLLFGLLSGTGLIAVYSFRLSPSDAYQPNVKPRLRSREMTASALRGASTVLAGMIAAFLTHGGSVALNSASRLALWQARSARSLVSSAPLSNGGPSIYPLDAWAYLEPCSS